MNEKTPTNLPTNDWLDDLIAWADEHDVPERNLPRDKQEILRLTILDFGGNKLTALPESLGNLTNLTELNLDGNPIKELPSALSHLQDIVKFDEI